MSVKGSFPTTSNARSCRPPTISSNWSLEALRLQRISCMVCRPTQQLKNTTRETSRFRAHVFQPHILAPASLCAAICSFVCRVRTSLRDGLIGCAQSQSFLNRGSVAHPAVETAIKSSIAIGLNVMSNPGPNQRDSGRLMLCPRLN